MIHTITIDWKTIKSESEFYDSLFLQVNAPEWHGRNLDALNDSLVNGEINGIEPPYDIVLANEDGAPQSLTEFVQKVRDIIETASSERGIKIIQS